MFVTDHASYCSACFNSVAGERAVDFDAEWDGPTWPEGNITRQIDDLVLCKNCVDKGAELIGRDEAELTRLLRRIEELKGEVEKWRLSNKRLREAFDAQPKPKRQKAVA